MFLPISASSMYCNGSLWVITHWPVGIFCSDLSGHDTELSFGPVTATNNKISGFVCQSFLAMDQFI